VSLPRRVHLPDRGWVELRTGDAPDATPPRTLRETTAALDGSLVRIVDGEGAPVAAGTLTLRDAAVTRAVLTQLEIFPEDPTDVVCENCDAPFTVQPCAELGLAPYFDGEADDDELDARFPFDETHEIPAVELKKGAAATVRLRDVTLGEVEPLHRALETYRLRITGEVVRAMGLVALGDETQPARIGRALARASDEALDVVFDLFDEAHYPPRLSAEARCPKCGASNPVEAPTLREFPAEPMRRAGRDALPPGFPDEAAFEGMVVEEADAIYARLGVRNVGLEVVHGPADCDDGGVPLLGSYTPPEPEGAGLVAREPEVRVYYRTFRAMWADEPYDVRAEIAETIEHELEHHLAFLSGDDPEDEAERGQIAREARQRTGDTETLRQASRAARGELADFLYRTWPVWAVVAAATVAAALASR
jgi:hypothetical protein